MLFEHKVDMEISGDRTALVLVDIQNDFLTDGGKYYIMIEELMKKNNVNTNLESLLRAAKDHGYPVFMSPHYFFPHDHKGKTSLGPMEDLALHGGVVARESPLHTRDVPGGGADVPDRFRFDPGFVSPLHTHTYDYYAVVIKGDLENYQPGQKPEKLGPGSYWYQRGMEAHTTACVSKQPCEIYIVQQNKFDAQIPPKTE